MRLICVFLEGDSNLAVFFRDNNIGLFMDSFIEEEAPITLPVKRREI